MTIGYGKAFLDCVVLLIRQMIAKPKPLKSSRRCADDK
jgi:hypothetical protein